MPTFTPTTADGNPRADPHSGSARDRLMKFYGSNPTGVSVWKDQGGVWHQQQYPYHGRLDAPGLAQAQLAFIGGHTYEISDAVAAELIAAGFGDGVNSAVVDYTWFKPEFTTKWDEWHMTDHSNSVYGMRVNSAENLEIFEVSGDLPIQDNSRRFFVHDDTHFNSDFDAQVVLDPVAYGAFGIAEQSGLVLRAQISGGKYRGITINNNIFFVVPNCNIGVWSTNLDGSGFQNRQASLAIGLLVQFPMRYDVKLRGNIITVRAYGDRQPVPRWDDPLYALTVDLDSTQAGTSQQLIDNPTPVGDGGAGLIAAHLGSLVGIAARYRGLRMGPARSLFPDGTN